MVVGAVFAVAQSDLKKLLAFSTVSQLGYIVAGLALGTDLGVAAGLYYAVSHGLFKGTLFLCAGAVQHATGTRDMRTLGGIAPRMPVTTAVWLVAAAAIVGVPGTTGFVAKWLLFGAALEARQVVVVAVAWIVSLVTVFYFLKATISVFYGAPGAGAAHRGHPRGRAHHAARHGRAGRTLPACSGWPRSCSWEPSSPRRCGRSRSAGTSR